MTESGMGDSFHETPAELSKALDECPEDEKLRIRLIDSLIVSGDLAEAARLATEVPGNPSVPLRMVLERLALALQNAGDHRGALDAFSRRFESVPFARRTRVGRVADAVRAAEEYLVTNGSILPAPPFTLSRQGKIAAVAILALLILTTAVGLAEHQRTHKCLYVLNGTSQQVKVELSVEGKRKQITLAPHEQGLLVLSEGKYTAEILRGEALQKLDFELVDSFFARMGGKTVFILNVAGAAAVEWEERIYTYKLGIQPGRERVHFGEQFLVIPDVDHRFEPWPERVTVRENRLEQATRVGMLRGPATVVTDQLPRIRALDFLELHLSLYPGEVMLLRNYLNRCRELGRSKRCEEFLSTRPAWRQAYRDHQGGETGTTPLKRK